MARAWLGIAARAPRGSNTTLLRVLGAWEQGRLRQPSVRAVVAPVVGQSPSLVPSVMGQGGTLSFNTTAITSFSHLGTFQFTSVTWAVPVAGDIAVRQSKRSENPSWKPAVTFQPLGNGQHWRMEKVTPPTKPVKYRVAWQREPVRTRLVRRSGVSSVNLRDFLLAQV
jgi:hypothetical protein